MPRIRITNETNSGRREGWTKWVKSVDAEKPGGYAFEGEFLQARKLYDIPAGAILIRVDPEGSVKNNWQSGHVLRVEESGDLVELTEGSLNWRNDFLTIRDLVIEALGVKHNPLANISDEDILAEAKRRGLI